MVPEMLSSQPCCSGSINTHQNYCFYLVRRRDFRAHLQYIRSCPCPAIFSRGIRINVISVKTQGYGPVDLLRQSPRTAKRRNPDSSEFSKSKESCSAFRNQRLEVSSFSVGKCSVLGISENQLCSEDHSINEVYYLEETDEKVLSRRLLELSRRNKVRSALALHRSMKLSGLQPDSHACNSLLACLVRNGRVEDALNVFEFMKSQAIITGHSYSLILKAVSHSQGCDAALSMFEEAVRTKQHMDLIVFNTMIAIFGKVNNWSQAERIWRAIQESGNARSVITYRLLVCTFVRCGQNELALDAYHEMIRNGLRPSDDVMQAVIGACSREGKCDTALTVLQTMLDLEMKPSLQTFNALINMLAKTEQVEETFKLYDLILSLGYTPDAYSWNALLAALNQANRYSDALRLFDSISKQHKPALNLHVYNKCLVSCQRLGLWERAIQLLWEMEASGIRGSVTSYSLAIGACEAAREPMAALRVYHHMLQRELSPDSFTLLSLIRVCISGSVWSELENLLDSEANELLYNVAIQDLCLKKKRNLAGKLYTRMCEIGLNPNRKTRALMQKKLGIL